MKHNFFPQLPEADMDVVEPEMLAIYPEAFEALAGVSVAAFYELVAEIRPGLHAAEEARQDRPGRRRAPGAGRKAVLSIPEQVLVTLITTRFGAADDTGLMFGVGRDTVARAARRVLPLLLNSSVASAVALLSKAERRERFLTAVRGMPEHGGRVQFLGRRCGIWIDADGTEWPYGRVLATAGTAA